MRGDIRAPARLQTHAASCGPCMHTMLSQAVPRSKPDQACGCATQKCRNCGFRRNSRGSERSEDARTLLQPVRAKANSPRREPWDRAVSGTAPQGAEDGRAAIFRPVPGLGERRSSPTARAVGYWLSLLRSYEPEHSGNLHFLVAHPGHARRARTHRRAHVEALLCVEARATSFGSRMMLLGRVDPFEVIRLKASFPARSPITPLC